VAAWAAGRPSSAHTPSTGRRVVKFAERRAQSASSATPGVLNQRCRSPRPGGGAERYRPPPARVARTARSARPPAHAPRGSAPRLPGSRFAPHSWPTKTPESSPSASSRRPTMSPHSSRHDVVSLDPHRRRAVTIPAHVWWPARGSRLPSILHVVAPGEGQSRKAVQRRRATRPLSITFSSIPFAAIVRSAIAATIRHFRDVTTVSVAWSRPSRAPVPPPRSRSRRSARRLRSSAVDDEPACSPPSRANLRRGFGERFRIPPRHHPATSARDRARASFAWHQPRAADRGHAARHARTQYSSRRASSPRTPSASC